MEQHPSYRFPKAEHICSQKAVDRLFGEGKRGVAYPLRYMWRVSDDVEREPVRAMFSIPKRCFKRANKRNLLRRRTRESFRLSKSLLCESALVKGVCIDVAFIYTSKEEADYKTINNAVNKALAEICSRL